MRTSLFAAALALAATDCSFAAPSLDGKRCPCADGWTCDLGSNTCVRPSEAGVAHDLESTDASVRDASSAPSASDASPGAQQVGQHPGDCSVHADGRLYCANRAGKMFAQPDPASSVVNELRTTYSWFDCWALGAANAKGNRTWYHTFGDTTAASGYVDASAVDTTAAFDADPSAHGFARCGQ